MIDYSLFPVYLLSKSEHTSACRPSPIAHRPSPNVGFGTQCENLYKPRAIGSAGAKHFFPFFAQTILSLNFNGNLEHEKF